MTAAIGLYDDHSASAGWDGGGYPTICLCEGCTAKYGADVTLVYSFSAGEEMYCEKCGSSNLVNADSDAG